MRSNWQKTSLGEVCAFVNRGISPKYCDDGGISVLNQKCIRNHALHFSLARRHDITAKAVPQPRLIQAGDVLVNSTGVGTLGRVAQVRAAPTEATTVDSHITIVRPREGMFFPDFFGYMLIAIEDQIKESGAGCGGQTELARATLANQFTVSFPTSILEQQHIVAKLDEAFAAIAKAKENAEKNVANARAMFESELSTIFLGTKSDWLTKPLGETCTNLDSMRVPVTKSSRASGDVPYYGASGVVDHVKAHIFDEDLLLVSEDGANLLARTYPIAFSISGKSWVNNHAHVLQFNDLATQKFIEFYLNSISLKPYVSGMAQPKLNQKALNTIPVPFPHPEKRKEIVCKLEELAPRTCELASIYNNKISKLDDLKQSFLHNTFTGQL